MQYKIMKKELVSELKRVSKLVKDEPDTRKKLYYYSAAYGITSRVMKFSFRGDLLLADMVLNQSYLMVTDRLNKVMGGDTTVELKPEVFSSLSNGVLELALAFEKEEPVQVALEKILITAYSTNGPGNYLKEKGALALDK